MSRYCLPLQIVDKTSILHIVNTKLEKPSKDGFDAIVGDRLKTARIRTIFERIDVANKIGVPKETVRNWERGLAVMPAVYWAPVCEMLYIDPWELLVGASRRTLMPDLPSHLRRQAASIRSA